MTSIDEEMDNLEPSFITGGYVKCCSLFGNLLEDFKKLNIGLPRNMTQKFSPSSVSKIMINISLHKTYI